MMKIQLIEFQTVNFTSFSVLRKLFDFFEGYSNGTTINDLGSMNNQFGVSSDEDQTSQIHLPDSQEDLINSSSISINYITDHSPSKDLGHKNSSKDEDVIYSQTLEDATKEVIT